MSLEDLKTADWSDIVDDYYEPPKGVVELLQALAFDPAAADGAIIDLNVAIYHQGDVYETTVRAIPYLIALLRSEEPMHLRFHRELLIALAMLYGGNGTDYRQGTHQAIITDSVQRAVRAGLSTYIQRLYGRRLDVQRAALLLLGSLREDAAQIIPLVRRRYDAATDTIQKAALLYCYGRLLPHGERQSFVRPIFDNKRSSVLLRMMTAILLGETEATGLAPILSGLPCDGQDSMPESVRAFLEGWQEKYGEPAYEKLEEQFATVVCESEVLDVVFQALLDTDDFGQ